MHGSRLGDVLRRSAVAAVLAGLAVTLVPAAPASAADVTCTYNGTTHVATVTTTAQSTEVDIMRTPGTTFISVNATLCMGGPTQAATTTNTKRIVVNLNGAANRANINLSLGAFAPGFGNEPGTSDEIEFTVSSQADDVLAIVGRSSADRFRLGTTDAQSRVNLNAQETTGVDSDVTMIGAGSLWVFGVGGNDTISANGAKGTGSPLAKRVEFVGGTGNDALTGGPGNDSLSASSFDSDPDDHDVIKGMGGTDLIDAADGDGLDEVDGGGATDQCLTDVGDTIVGC
jgi:hypothetical protein